MTNRLLRWGLMLTLCVILPSCNNQQVVKKPVAPPGPTFTGPAYLNGTVGSMTSRRGYAPMLVSGYGLVVNLPGTGSPDVPGFLRQAMIQHLRSEGFGSRRAGLADMTPDSILASEDTAMVAVEGLIPPAAVKGTHFDVLVSALPQTGTTNLDGGFLRTTDLSLFGTNEQMRFSRTLAKARGSMYLRPFDASGPEKVDIQQNLQAVVLGGGVVSRTSALELVLNQPSWTRSAQIAQRINEVFRQEPVDRDPTAVAKTDLIIRINVPSRYASDVGRFLDLMEHVYTQRGPSFEMTQARRLGEVITLAPREARQVALAWEGLGKRALPVIRSYYDASNLTVRLAALQAGVRLDDQLAADPLLKLSTSKDVHVRLKVAQTLADLHNSLRGTRVLLTLLDDDDNRVRIAAYKALREDDNPAIKRTAFNWDNQPKFVLELVPSRKPLIYISTTDGPRVVIFDPMTGFKSPMLAQLWDNQLMLRREKDSGDVTVFFQNRGQIESQTQTIAATAANLVFLLAHESTIEYPTPGYNLPFGRVVNVLYQLCKSGDIMAPFEIQESPLAQRISQARQEHGSDQGRPWTGPATTEPATQPATQPGTQPGVPQSEQPAGAVENDSGDEPDQTTPEPQNSGRPQNGVQGGRPWTGSK